MMRRNTKRSPANLQKAGAPIVQAVYKDLTDPHLRRFTENDENLYRMELFAGHHWLESEPQAPSAPQAPAERFYWPAAYKADWPAAYKADLKRNTEMIQAFDSVFRKRVWRVLDKQWSNFREYVEKFHNPDIYKNSSNTSSLFKSPPGVRTFEGLKPPGRKLYGGYVANAGDAERGNFDVGSVALFEADGHILLGPLFQIQQKHKYNWNFRESPELADTIIPRSITTLKPLDWIKRESLGSVRIEALEFPSYVRESVPEIPKDGLVTTPAAVVRVLKAVIKQSKDRTLEKLVINTSDMRFWISVNGEPAQAVNPFFLAYFWHRMGPCYLLQNDALDPIFVLPVSQPWVQDNTPANFFSEYPSQVGIVMPQRKD